MPLDVGSHVGPYEITGSIGAGGMGEVYRARDTRLGREVAVKVLPHDLRLHLLLQFECSRRFVQAELTYGRHAG